MLFILEFINQFLTEHSIKLSYNNMCIIIMKKKIVTYKISNKKKSNFKIKQNKKEIILQRFLVFSYN